MTDAIIEDWYLVDLENEGSVIAQVLWGIIVEDRKSRWVSGNFVCTSPVIKYLGEGLYQTLNSQYQCQGNGRKVTLEAEALLDLRSGFSPDEYLARKGQLEQDFHVR